MAPSHYERQEAAREERLVHMREQVASGELTVRQMTRAERKRWDERAAEADRRATPEERARREAARAKLRAKTERAA
jgi:hypothetical protein